MEIIDTNIVLRYLIRDDERMALQAKEIIENRNVFIPFEVFAEVVYVLQKVYRIDKKEIEPLVLGLLEFSNIRTTDNSILQSVIPIFANNKIDFVDTLLCAYAEVHNYTVHSFDKKINKYINSL